MNLGLIKISKFAFAFTAAVSLCVATQAFAHRVHAETSCVKILTPEVSVAARPHAEINLSHFQDRARLLEHPVTVEYRNSQNESEFITGRVLEIEQLADDRIDTLTVQGFIQKWVPTKDGAPILETVEDAARGKRTISNADLVNVKTIFKRASQDALQTLESLNQKGQAVEGSLLVVTEVPTDLNPRPNPKKITGRIERLIREPNSNHISKIEFRTNDRDVLEFAVADVVAIDFGVEVNFRGTSTKRAPEQRFPDLPSSFPRGSSPQLAAPAIERTRDTSPGQIAAPQVAPVVEAELAEIAKLASEPASQDSASLEPVRKVISKSPYSELARSPVDGDLIEGFLIENGAVVHKEFQVTPEYVTNFQAPMNEFLAHSLGAEKADEIWERKTSLVSDIGEIQALLVSDLEKIFGPDPQLKDIRVTLLSQGGMHHVYEISVPDTIAADPRFPGWRILRVQKAMRHRSPKTHPNESPAFLERANKQFADSDNNFYYSVIAREIGISYLAASNLWRLPVLNITSDETFARRGWTATTKAVGHSVKTALTPGNGIFAPTLMQQARLSKLIRQATTRGKAFATMSQRYFYSRLKGSHLSKMLDRKRYTDVTGWDVRMPDDLILVQLSNLEAGVLRHQSNDWIVRLNVIRKNADGSVITNRDGSPVVAPVWFKVILRDF